MATIHQLVKGDKMLSTSWDDFVSGREDATFFHRSGWQNVISDVFRHETYYFFAESGGKISGVLPLAHVNSIFFGRSLTSLPFAVYGGVVANDEATAVMLEEHAQSVARELKVDSLEFRNKARRHQRWPVQDLYVTFRKRISGDREVNMLAIPRKQRAMVRKGFKAGLFSEADRDIDRFFTLYSNNVHRHGTPPLPKRYFKSILDEFGSECEILTVYDAKRQPLSAVLSFYFKDEVLPYYAGDTVLARECAANDFKYWELMSHATDRGVSIFDFGRSKRGSGSFDFKKNWGFAAENLNYEYCLFNRNDIPQNNPANAKFRFLIESWKRLPIGVANFIGPHIVKNLG